MPNKIKAALLIFFTVILLLILYLVITSKPVAVDKNKIQENAAGQPTVGNNVFVKYLDTAYRSKVKLIFSNYLHLVQSEDLSVEQLEQTKNQLMSITVTKEFKELHLNFVLAVAKMKSFLETGDEEEKLASQNLIDKIKVDYGWLSNY